MMRFCLASFLIVLTLTTVAGAQDPPTSGSPAGEPAENGEYRVGIGDVISVEAFQEDEISGDFPVESSGAITYPLLGAVSVAGMTPAEIASVLEAKLEMDYYVDVQLKVAVGVFASQPVTLLGEVQAPGTYYLEGRTTLTELLSKAGGLKSSAGPVLELRRTARIEGEGPPEPMIFETAKLSTGEAGRDVILRAGDVLSAALVFAGTTWLAFSTRDFALFNVGLVIVWVVLAILIGRRYQRLTAPGLAD